MRSFTLIIFALVFAVLFAISSAFFVVDEGTVAFVSKFGRIVRLETAPGLHMKLPLIESIHVFDGRLQLMETAPARYFTSEQKDVSLDFFVIGRIRDVRTFFRATGGSQSVALARLAPIITDSLRNQINAHTLQELVSSDRSALIAKQLPAINKAIASIGMYIVDLRIKQIDLPADSRIINDVYERMRAQRKQEAAKLRAEGEEKATSIRAQADQEAVITIANAQRDADELKGQGEAQAMGIFAHASQADPSFFAYYSSLAAYRNTMRSGNNLIILSKDDPFLTMMHPKAVLNTAPK